MKQESITGVAEVENSLGAASIASIILPLLAPMFFVVTTIIGAVRWFSPVPFWDMWDGTLQFYVARLQGAHWSPFLEQANEHRIILSKILFWVDYRYFHGLSYFLIFMNLVLMGCLWATLCVAARRLMGTHQRLTYLCCALIGVLCFSWLQAENINWGYQSQFYMAYLLPLLALISMACWIKEPTRIGWFVTASVLGMLSTITMANGVLALPLLVLMLALSGKSTSARMGALLAVTVVTIAAWTYHYHSTPHAGAPFRDMVKFLLMFFGAPFGWLFHNDILTMLMGAAAILASAYLAVQWLRSATRDPMYLALVLFVVHIGAAGAAATVSRANFGLVAALAGRYETPLMLFYCALLLLFSHLYRERVSTPAVVTSLSIFATVMLFAAQLGTIDAAGPGIARQRMQAALALNLGVDDRDTIRGIYPQETAERREQVRRAAENAKRYNLSVFGSPELKIAREALGKSPAAMGLTRCDGNVDSVAPIAGDARNVMLTGWVFDESTGLVPKSAIVASNGVVTGAVLTGVDRPDVQRTISRSAKRAGFQGYSLSVDPKTVVLYCQS